jgi:hypothetical protein
VGDTAEERAPEQRLDADVDLTKPSAARMYDWYLGGTRNWAVDREFGERAVARWPHVKLVAQHNRAFLRRVVGAALDAGIRQFLDLGTGVPTVGNIHDIIRRRRRKIRARVVYVDYEPVAAGQGRQVLDEDEVTHWAALVQRDLRDPEAIFDDPDVRRLINPGQPVCILFIAVMHFIGDGDDPRGILDAYREAAAPGSWLALTHACNDAAPEPGAAAIQAVVDSYRDTSNPMWLRDFGTIKGWLDVPGWDLLKPGIVHPPDWRPAPGTRLTGEQADARPYMWAGVAAKT